MLSDVTVVKVGGNEMDDPAWIVRLARALATRPEPVLIVHGGGKEVTQVQRTLGAEPEWVDGLRVTDEPALRAVSMVLSGVVNKRLVAALITAGVKAAGISGEDGSLFLAEPALGGRLGRTGEIREVRTELPLLLMSAGVTPVVSPVSRGTDGLPLNVNADDAAAALAAAIGAARFLLVSNVPGLLDGATMVGELEVESVEGWISSGAAHGGMAPKLRAAARAAGAGVAEVRIGDLDMLFAGSSGTRLVRAPLLAATA